MILLFSFVIIFSSVSEAQKIIPARDPNNILITFGSCNKYSGEENNHIYYRIAEMNADVWIWLGDVVYVDQRVFPTIFIYSGDSKVKKKFIEAKNSIAYTYLRNHTNVIGVWDDHDYGLNNGGKYFKHKTFTREVWLDYIDEPLDSPRRTREGIYESYYIGDPTKVKVILLDVRYSKDEHSVLGGGDMLGEEQWKWLGEQLRDNPASITLIGSGTQILPDDRIFTETWYPESRQRLLDLFKTYKVKGVILLSGDVHYAEIMRHPCIERVGFNLYEFTSSGLTHYSGETVPLADKIINTVFPDTYSTDEDRYFQRNFGVIRLNFSGKNPDIKLEVRNYYGIEVLEENLDYPKLIFDDKLLANNTVCELDESRYGRIYEKVIESLLFGNFYPLLIPIAAFYAILTAILIGLIMKKFIYLVFGPFFRKKSEKKHKKED